MFQAFRPEWRFCTFKHLRQLFQTHEGSYEHRLSATHSPTLLFHHSRLRFRSTNATNYSTKCSELNSAVKVTIMLSSNEIVHSGIQHTAAEPCRPSHSCIAGSS